MTYRHALVSVIAVACGTACGGEAKPPHSDRNDALNETQGHTSATSEVGTVSESIASTKPHPSSTATGVNESPHTAVPSATTGSPVPTTTAGVTTAPSDSVEPASPEPHDAGLTVDVSDAASGEEGVGKACGARAGDTCAASEYCAYAPSQLCGRADAQATCKPRPESCTADYNPVCGCDGMTYGNSCTAASAGVGVLDEGACAGTEPEPADCENIQCFRAITCAESCTSEVVQAGCCPCPPGLIDTFTECAEPATDQ